MPRVIDLRSDTVTRPTSGMRDAMARAEVGDDLMGDDPTTRALEEAAAARVGKEAGLFVPSGTMGNLVALLAHCVERGDEAIAGSESHICNHEGMGSSALGGIPVRVAQNDVRGYMQPAELKALARPWPRTVLACIENTHNRCGGAALTVTEMRDMTRAAHQAGLRVHVDGARIFNAAAALETEPATLVADADTVQFCFSKGLGAPVGSILTGPREFIDRARLIRRMVGGSMRQSGVIAAAALYALEHHVERLSEDHANARRLAAAVAEMPHVRMDPAGTDTNIVFFDLVGVDGPEFRKRLAAEGVLCSGTSPSRIRMVTHLDVSAADIEDAIPLIARVLERLPAA